METVETIFVKALALIDELLPSGVYDPAKVADYKGRTVALVDMCQKELFKAGDYFKIHELAWYPAGNMLGYESGFDITEFVGHDLTYETPKAGAKAYYFEADSNGGTAYIEDYTGTWNTLATINLVNTTSGFVPYKGAVTPTGGATKSRIRFSGTNYYKTVNRALFDTSFENGKIPVYQPWVKVALPTDVKRIDQVIIEYPEQKYARDSVYKIEWSGTRQYLYIQYYFKGKIRVQYKPVPTTITATTDTLEIDDITAQLISFYLAENFAAAEQNDYLAGLFKNKYNELKNESFFKQPIGNAEIIDVYGA